ncbi:MAG: type III-A CRISPR-associated RAMP protein Csm4 [Cryomorphaceae bacterium]|nr:type III-A CRISPR-associated RAMP protein Csm4 [Cryomorphaceae bacterium]
MSTNTYAIYLRFSSPVHFGSAGLDYGKSELSLHNDTLYAAIFNSLALIGQENRIPNNSNELKYSLSSCFPYYFDGKTYTCFFPRPYTQVFSHLNDFQAGGSDARKALKKVQYLDKSNFLSFCKNGFLPSEVNAINGLYYTNHPDFSAELKLTSSEVYPRVMVSRKDGEDAKPYYIERLFFFDDGKKFAGLYFLFHGNKEDLNTLKMAMSILQDEGLGTDRKIGHGQFTFTIEEFDLPKIDGNGAVSLGLLSPPDKEWLKQNIVDSGIAGYQLKRRGGWITSEHLRGLRKNDLQMFMPGSVFGQNCNDIKPEGVMHDILPESIEGRKTHPVWRVGKTLLFPIKIKRNE